MNVSLVFDFSSEMISDFENATGYDIIRELEDYFFQFSKTYKDIGDDRTVRQVLDIQIKRAPYTPSDVRRYSIVATKHNHSSEEDKCVVRASQLTPHSGEAETKFWPRNDAFEAKFYSGVNQ